MKTLVLIRHGKSLYDEYVGSDIERHLAPRGYADVNDSLNWCKREKLVPGLLVSSPAIRAYSTALIFANGYGYLPDQIALAGAIYEAGVQQLLYVLASIPEKAKTVFLFGHNPGFTDLTNFLCGPEIHHLPTAGVVVMDVIAKEWKEIGKQSCILSGVFSGHKPLQ